MPKYNFVGHDDGLNVINDGHGNFHDEPMTPGQLAAREPARLIAERIYELANKAGFAYILAHEIIAPVIDERIAALESELAALRTRNDDELLVSCYRAISVLRTILRAHELTLGAEAAEDILSDLEQRLPDKLPGATVHQAAQEGK